MTYRSVLSVSSSRRALMSAKHSACLWSAARQAMLLETQKQYANTEWTARESLEIIITDGEEIKDAVKTVS